MIDVFRLPAAAKTNRAPPKISVCCPSGIFAWGICNNNNNNPDWESVRGERANFTGLVLGGGGGGGPDYLQKLQVPEGYEKINDYSIV